MSSIHTGTPPQAHYTHNPAPTHSRSTPHLMEGLPSPLWPPDTSSSHSPGLSVTQGSREKKEEADSTLRNNSTKPRMCVCVCVSPLLCSRLHRAFGGETTLLGAKSGCHDNHCRSTPPISISPTIATLGSSGGDATSLIGVFPSSP